MIFIAHRGNVYGKNTPLENTPKYISTALSQGYNVEIDVWHIDGNFFLGHDEPETLININFILQDNIWVHAKNSEALQLLKNISNCFFHNRDDYTLTSKNYIWVYPGKTLIPGCVAVLPEQTDYSTKELNKSHAICTDFVKDFHDKINNFRS